VSTASCEDRSLAEPEPAPSSCAGEPARTKLKAARSTVEGLRAIMVVVCSGPRSARLVLRCAPMQELIHGFYDMSGWSMKRHYALPGGRSQLRRRNLFMHHLRKAGRIVVIPDQHECRYFDRWAGRRCIPRTLVSINHELAMFAPHLHDRGHQAVFPCATGHSLDRAVPGKHKGSNPSPQAAFMYSAV